MKLHLKFVEDAGEDRRDEVADAALHLGATAVRPLFPDGDDDTRRSMYIVDLADGADPERVSRSLRSHDAVESIEPEFQRYLAAS